jgi:arylesterase/paraoxonase
MRGVKRAGHALAFGTLLAGAALAPAAAVEDVLQCRRVALRDAGSGAPVKGAEDIAVDAAGGWLYLSAFDRWALEDALAAGADSLPQGGIYAAPLEEVVAADDSLAVRRLTTDLSGDFHPHGIALFRDVRPRRLFAINHAHTREGREWRRTTRIDLFDVEGPALRPAGSLRDPALCRANDLAALSPSAVLVSRDHGACRGLGKWIEDALGLSHAKVLLAGRESDGGSHVTTVIDGLGFANGLALSPGGDRLAVAATREGRVYIHDVAALRRGEAAASRSLRLDGGPDNLSWTADGRVLAAVHPSMLKAGIARHRWFGKARAGRRVVDVEPDDGTVAPLLNDPAGVRLNMATVAVAFAGIMVVGAVLDDAILVCEEGRGVTGGGSERASRDSQANDTGRDSFHSQ